MRKMLLGTTAFIALATLAACDAAPTPGSLLGTDLVTVDHEYEIDTYGSNSEVYEFTPRSNTNKACVMLMLDSGAAMGLFCFDKPAQ